MKRKIISLIFGLFLASAFLIFRRNELYPLLHRQFVPPEITRYKQEVLDKYYQYQAINIFDKGYNRLLGSELNNLLTIYPQDKLLNNSSLSVSFESSEKIVKVFLPKEFKDGILRIDSNSESAFSIGISYDLKNWGFFNYPGYSEQLMNILYLKQSELSNNMVYLEFLPLQNKSLNVNFVEFQYISTLPKKMVDYSGHILFFPDVDVDYNGQIINKPGIIIR